MNNLTLTSALKIRPWLSYSMEQSLSTTTLINTPINNYASYIYVCPFRLYSQEVNLGPAKVLSCFLGDWESPNPHTKKNSQPNFVL